MSVEEFCDEKVADLENKILELGPENVACFIAEPIMGGGGVIVPPPGYHARTKAVCEKYEVLYISDEVVTGFGRLGHFFASEPVFNFTPDIITSAKGLTSGYIPHSATLFSDAIYEVISVPQSEGALFTPRLHLCRAPGFLRRRAQEHRDHGARGPVRPRARGRPPTSRRGSTSC